MLDSITAAVRALATPRSAPSRPCNQVGGSSRVVNTRRDSAPSCAVEPLEDRQLLSVVYVSRSAGSDRNAGSSPNSAVASFARARKLVGPGDTMLLRAGDTWNEAIGDWNKSNTSIGSFGGGARPRVNTSADGIYLGTASNVAIRGVSLNAVGRTKATGIILSGRNSNVTIDNVEVRGFRMNITAQGYFGPVKNLTIRNSQITDANGNGMSSGLYADKVQGLLLENNLFDRNGGEGSIFNHGAYITGLSSGLVARGNTFSNSSNYGMQARSGGVITDNVFRNNSVGLSVGLVNGSGTHTAGGVTATVTNNTFTGVGTGLKAGLGIELGNIKSSRATGSSTAPGSATPRRSPSAGATPQATRSASTT